LQRLGMPLTVENLQAAWNHAKASGAYNPTPPQQSQFDYFGQSSAPPPSTPRPGIPSLTGGTSPGYDSVFDRFAELPLDQMEAVINRISRGGS